MYLVALVLIVLIIVIALCDDTKDLYLILGCTQTCTSQQLKKSYRKLALQLHPDKVMSSASEESKEMAKSVFIELQSAYEVLSDPEKRLQYDLSLQGINYDIVKDPEIDRYTSRPFSTFIKTGRFRFFFSAHFEKPVVEDILLQVQVCIPNNTYRINALRY